MTNATKVLLLGSQGQVGWELQHSKPSSIDLYALNHLDLDIRDADKVREVAIKFQPDCIINAAAYTAVDRAETDVDLAYAINCDGAANCALAAKVCNAKLIHISTDFVFDGKQSIPYHPEIPTSAIGVYGASKAAGEEQVKKILNDGALILRTAWVYSSHGNNFVKTMLRLMLEKDVIRVVGDQIGSPTYALGLANAIWKSINNPNFIGIQHWTDSGIASWYDFAVAIQEEAINVGYLKNSIPIEMIPTGSYPTLALRSPYTVLDKTNSYQILGHALHWRIALRQMLTKLKQL